jgi:hypothetical protein
MSSKTSLEAERQAILFRMQASRDEYRRMLMDEPEVHHLHSNHMSADQLHGGGMASHYQQAHNPAAEIAGAAFTWMKKHPLVCAAAVAAMVAIGPRRIARTAMSGGTALTALTLRNPQNIDVVTRLLSTVAGYMQRDRTR